MSKNICLKDIIEVMELKYKSFEFPNYSFVKNEITNNPYKDLVETIGNITEIQEDTDPNDDVSFGYLLTLEKNEWFLRISMLGPYAVLSRISEKVNIELIDSDTKNLSPTEYEIIKVLQKSSIVLLPKNLLETPINLKLYNTNPKNTKVYQALFTDNDILPWSE